MKKIFTLGLCSIALMAQPPSQNSALNAISPDSNYKHKNTKMQNSLDSWLEDEWKPTQEKEEKVTKNEKKEDNSSFKLQNYVDKWSAYNKEKEKEPKKESHLDKINSLPVIGN
jgi:hypothetical protein